MKKSLIILFIIFTSVNKSEAQGLLGKRFSSSYEFGSSFLGRIEHWDKYLLFRHTIDINYALSKRFTFGLGINHAKKTLPHGTPILALTNTNGWFGTQKMSGNFHGAQINDFTFSATVKYFARKNGCYAPNGLYVGLTYEHGWQNTLSEYINNNNQTFVSYDNKDRTTLSVVSLTYGRNMIINYKYLLGYGISLGYNRTRDMQFRRFIARPFVSFGILF